MTATYSLFSIAAGFRQSEIASCLRLYHRRVPAHRILRLLLPVLRPLALLCFRAIPPAESFFVLWRSFDFASCSTDIGLLDEIMLSAYNTLVHVNLHHPMKEVFRSAELF